VVPWVLEPLLREVETLPPESTVIEIGCGTGNYAIALSKALESCVLKGFDLSEEMLSVACSRSPGIEWAMGRADVQFPYPAEHCEFTFAVDVVHHLGDIGIFFAEVARVLKPEGRLVIVTDSEADIRSRSLTQYFPEVLEIELARYPRLTALHDHAQRAGLRPSGAKPARGRTEIDDACVSTLEAKGYSCLRLIPEQAYRSGIERVRHAQGRGEKWLSCYTVVRYKKN
jgi:SAM-dependent methyltransferase